MGITKRETLSAAKVANHHEPGYLCDGGGLYLQTVARKAPYEGVTKSWVFRYRNRGTGKLCELGLGSTKDVSLREARDRAAKLREQLRDGVDPKQERQQSRANLRAEAAKAWTFDECAASCINTKRHGWKNAKHADQWENTLGTYASPIIGKLPVQTIDSDLVCRVLEPIWASKNETASRVRQRIEAVLDWATARKRRTGDNPARWKGNLEHVFAKPLKIREHHPALPYGRMFEFLDALHQQNGIAPLALEFAILTATRTNETLCSKPEEFDLEQGVWTIPAARMKAGQEHAIPLPARAVEIVKQLTKAKIGPYVFPGGKKNKPLSNMALLVLMRKMHASEVEAGRAGWLDSYGKPAVPHGFRSSFRDWAGEQTNFPREVIEHCMAHRLKDKAEAAYARGTAIEKRRKLMDAWARYCHTKPAASRNVKPLKLG